MAGLETAPQAQQRLLLVEDNPLDARIIGAHLRAGANGPFALDHVERLDAAQSHLANESIDCILLDLSLPDAQRLEALAALQLAHPDVPVIVLSGYDESVLGAEAVQAGAQDFLTKGETDGRQLWRAVRYAVERKRAELLLRYQSLHCALTGLPNRVLFIDRLEVAINRLARQPGTVAVMFLDLDGFKWINDSLGHNAGDEVLVEVARRVDSVLRPYDTAARHGGDEFLVLTETTEGVEDAHVLADRIRAMVSRPIELSDGQTVRITASVGVAATSDAGATGASLLRDADAAMFRAKRGGRDQLATFDDAMRSEATTRMQLLSQLHHATDHNQFRVHYQPIVELATGELHGWEALLRWERPDGTLVAPGEFIELLEEQALIVPIGDFVLKEATQWLAKEHARLSGGKLPSISVNMSAVQLTRPSIVQRVAEVLAESGIAPEYVCLELTESQVIVDDDAVSRRLLALKELGVRLSMDDYGTGYSTLWQLRRLPFDSLKIDRSFVAGLGLAQEDAQIVHAIVQMGGSLGLTVIGEGVETREQAQFLRAYGCPLGQGYLFGRPSADGRRDDL